MKFIIKNVILVEHLQKIHRLLTKNISFPILENILFQMQDGILLLTVNNLEIEIITKIIIYTKYEPGKITISGRKLFNICRCIPKNSDIKMELKNNKMYINADKSSYILSTLPPDNFPKNQKICPVSEFYISSDIFKNMIDKIEFSMGKNDVRHYLNGMLLEKKDTLLRSVATDGYRLAMSSIIIKEEIISFSIIIPRKGILELSRLLNIKPQSIRIVIGSYNIQVYIKNLIFTAQLMEGQYPDYNSVLLKKLDKPIISSSTLLKESLSRVAILSHEKFCGVEINIHNGQFKIISDNQEEETAQDIFVIDDNICTAEISINVYYILDVLNAIKSQNIFLFINTDQSSIQITEENNTSTIYVIMLLKR